MRGQLKIVPYFVSHAGCPHHCVFCNQRVINQQETHSVEAFEAFITKFTSVWVPDTPYQLAFFGGTFTAIPRDELSYYLTRAKELIDQGKIESVRCSTRPDAITQDIIDYLIQHGVKTVELGVQSLNDRVLACCQRGHTQLDAQNASKLIVENGLELGHQLMIGLPGDDFETFKETVRLSLSLGPKVVRLYPTQVLKETALAADYLGGRYTPLPTQTALEWTIWAKRAYENAGVKVIKVGLQANEALMDPDVRLAGPYHPAYGEWVEALMVQERLRGGVHRLMGQTTPTKPLEDATLTVYCHPKCLSKTIGLSKINVSWLLKEFGLNLVVVGNVDLAEGELMIVLGRRALQIP